MEEDTFAERNHAKKVVDTMDQVEMDDAEPEPTTDVKRQVIYGLEDVPPWYATAVFGFQVSGVSGAHFIFMKVRYVLKDFFYFRDYKNVKKIKSILKSSAILKCASQKENQLILNYNDMILTGSCFSNLFLQLFAAFSG